MRTSNLLILASISTFIFFCSEPSVWAEPLNIAGVTVDLECRNPEHHQDIGKTPKITNPTDSWLPKGTKITWTASDGDKGTIILPESLAPYAKFFTGPMPEPPEQPEFQERGVVYGVGKPGQIYTCEAHALRKPQIKESELEIISAKDKWEKEKMCLGSSTKLLVRVANNGAAPANFMIVNPHTSSKTTSYNLLANQVTEFEIWGASGDVITNDQVSIPIYLTNSHAGNPQCEKYGSDDPTDQNLTPYCDSDMTNQMVLLHKPYGNTAVKSPDIHTPLPCPEQMPKTQVASDDIISVISSHSVKDSVVIKIKNSGLNRSDSYFVEIKNPKSGKTIWNDSISFPSGMKILKIDTKSFDFKNQPLSKTAYHILVNKKKIGTVFIENEGQSQKIGKQVRKSGKTGMEATRTAKPNLDLRLSLNNRALEVGNKATILISVKNSGKGVLNKSDSYSLHCSSKCPFGRNKMNFNFNLESGETKSFILTSNALAAGNYDITMKTNFGSSQKLKFNVKPADRKRSKPTKPPASRPEPVTSRES